MLDISSSKHFQSLFVNCWLIDWRKEVFVHSGLVSTRSEVQPFPGAALNKEDDDWVRTRCTFFDPFPCTLQLPARPALFCFHHPQKIYEELPANLDSMKMKKLQGSFALFASVCMSSFINSNPSSRKQSKKRVSFWHPSTYIQRWEFYYAHDLSPNKQQKITKAEKQNIKHPRLLSTYLVCSNFVRSNKTISKLRMIHMCVTMTIIFLKNILILLLCFASFAVLVQSLRKQARQVA